MWPPKMGFRGHFGPQAQFSGWNTGAEIRAIGDPRFLSFLKLYFATLNLSKYNRGASVKSLMLTCCGVL